MLNFPFAGIAKIWTLGEQGDDYAPLVGYAREPGLCFARCPFRIVKHFFASKAILTAKVLGRLGYFFLN